MKTLRWAMVGTGFMSTLILKDFAHVKNSELAVLASRDPERAKARLESEGVTADTATFQEVLLDPTIDIVYVATPHSEHFWQAKAALEAGKHVLVEKAFTMNAAEARQLRDLAKAKNLFLMEAMWTKFLPVHQEIFRRVREGAIGNIKIIEGNFGFFMEFDNNHRLFNFELGGGSALDQGVYPTTFCHWYAGSRLLSQVTHGENFANGADAHVETFLRYENNVTGIALSSLITSLGVAGRIVGDKGEVEFLGTFFNPDGALIKGLTGMGEKPSVEEVKIPKLGAGYAHMLQEVVDCINAGKIESDIHPLTFTIEIMELLDEARAQING